MRVILVVELDPDLVSPEEAVRVAGRLEGSVDRVVDRVLWTRSGDPGNSVAAVRRVSARMENERILPVSSREVPG